MTKTGILVSTVKGVYTALGNSAWCASSSV